MKIPGIGEILQEDGPTGRLWRVVGVRLEEGVDEEHPERKYLSIDVDPVQAPREIPETIRRGMET